MLGRRVGREDLACGGNRDPRSGMWRSGRLTSCRGTRYRDMHVGSTKACFFHDRHMLAQKVAVLMIAYRKCTEIKGKCSDCSRGVDLNDGSNNKQLAWCLEQLPFRERFMRQNRDDASRARPRTSQNKWRRSKLFYKNFSSLPARNTY